MSSSTVIYIKRFADGWGYLYPDPGWLPCPPDCKLCTTKAHKERPYIEGFTRFGSKLEAFRIVSEDHPRAEVKEWQSASRNRRKRDG